MTIAAYDSIEEQMAHQRLLLDDAAIAARAYEQGWRYEDMVIQGLPLPDVRAESDDVGFVAGWEYAGSSDRKAGLPMRFAARWEQRRVMPAKNVLPKVDSSVRPPAPIPPAHPAPPAATDSSSGTSLLWWGGLLGGAFVGGWVLGRRNLRQRQARRT